MQRKTLLSLVALLAVSALSVEAAQINPRILLPRKQGHLGKTSKLHKKQVGQERGRLERSQREDDYAREQFGDDYQRQQDEHDYEYNQNAPSLGDGNKKVDPASPFERAFQRGKIVQRKQERELKLARQRGHNEDNQ